MIVQKVENDQIASKFDFITPFINEYHNEKSLINGLDSLLSIHDINVKAIPFSCDKPPVEWFPIISGRSRKIKILKKYDGIQLFQMTCFFKEGKDHKEKSGLFFVYNHPEYKRTYVALTIEPSDFFRRAMLPFFFGHFPHIMMTFITHKRLKRLLENFQEENQFSKIIITRASPKCRISEEGKNEKIFPLQMWPKMQIEEAFNWVYQNNGWFQSLHFEAKKLSVVMEGSITREGIIQTNRKFSSVFKSFISPVCKLIYENIEFFDHRSRRESQNLSAKALTIDFDTDQFTEVSENKRFIQSLKQLNKASISVLHGNPYIHLSIVDYYDGSSFDLWVLNSNQVVIVPQMKSSIFSIKRLVNHIFDTYAEGDINDYKEVFT